MYFIKLRLTIGPRQLPHASGVNDRSWLFSSFAATWRHDKIHIDPLMDPISLLYVGAAYKEDLWRSVFAEGLATVEICVQKSEICLESKQKFEI